MESNLHLIIHNIGYILSTILLIFLTLFVYFKDRKPLANKMLIFSFVATAIYTTSHLFAVNLSDQLLSRQILTLNLSTIFIGVFIAHTVLALMNKVQEKKAQLISIYAFSIGLTLFMVFYPAHFLSLSVSKMYFTNYYDAGDLYALMMAWNIIVALYIFYQMLTEYRKADIILKNRLRYLFTAFLLAYIFGWQAYWLVFDIKIDPAWGALMVPSFSILFTYAVLKFDLLDIRIVAKKALIYSSTVIVVGLFIVVFNLLNNLIISKVPSFPIWIFPLFLASIVVTIGIIIWNQLKQDDILKSEFISTVTHKFRTPLTHIKWASENLSKLDLPSDASLDIGYIQTANNNLVELTNLLVNISETESASYRYNTEELDLKRIISEILIEIDNQLKIKQIVLKQTLPETVTINGDDRRIKFAIQTLIENAIHYSNKGGEIEIKVTEEDNKVTIAVTDHGIGMNKDEFPLLFSKFHRSKQATLTNTEGMGIGLFITKEIIARHKGKIWAESEGVGKGCTFFVELKSN